MNRNRAAALNPAVGVVAGLCLLASPLLASGQTLSFSTLAGSPAGGAANGTGASARFANPWGVAVDGAGNVYVADTDNDIIRKITPGGVVATLAGQAGVRGSANGTGTAAQFNQPQGVAVDGSGNVYVADTGNNTIRKITSAGLVTTLAGTAGVSGSANGTGGAAQFSEPEGIAVNSSGTLIYVADAWNHTLRQITAGAVVTTLAGAAGTPGSANGAGTAAQFNQPQGVAVDGSGNVYVGDTGNHTIRKVTSGGTVTTLAGTAGNYGSTNATGASAAFWGPQGLAVDGSGNVYVADSFNQTIRKITSGGVVTTFAGTAGSPGSADGTGAAARFWLPQSVAVDGSGNLYVADTANGTIRKITSAALVSTLAGSASAGSANGTGANARFAGPGGVAIDSAGNTYVADTANGTIRKITSVGAVSTLAGSAGNFGSANGLGSAARFFGPQGMAVDNSGNLYVADTANHTIRKVTSGGTVSTLAGSAGNNGVADGAGSAAAFNYPQGVAMDGAGNVYVADTGNHTIRKVSAGGVVTTVAGVPGCFGNLDDNGPGNGTNRARFYCPSGVAVDGAGNVYVADTRNHTIRKMTPDGTVSTLAGQPGVWGNADGTNGSARFNLPQAITVDASGNLFVLDSGNHTVRELSPVGSDWVVSTVAGLPAVSGSSDGAGAGARFFYPAGIAVNSAGAFSVADWGNNTVRIGASSANSAPSIVGQPVDVSVNQGQSASFSVTATGSAPLAYQWRFFGTNLAGATGSSLTVTNAQDADSGPYSALVTNIFGSVTSAPAMLTVLHPPVISLQPSNQLASVSNSVTFTVGVAQGSNLSYQWLLNGSAVAGATQSSYTISPVSWANAGTYSVVVTNSDGSTATSAGAALTVQQAPLTFYDGFEGYAQGKLDNNFGGPNATPGNPWWALSSGAQGTVTNAGTGVTPHGGAQMAGRSGSGFLQDYVNLIYRLNAGQPYYGNFMCEWWFYDPYGTGSGATSYADYMALGGYAPVSTTSDASGSITTFNQRMSLGAYNQSGYNVNVYQARIIGGAGDFGSANSWYNTATPRTAGWHHARIVFGIPDASNYAPVWMYIDNMTNATVYSPTSGNNAGINLIEMNHANSSSGYYDDLTFRAANDPWIVEQPLNQTVNVGQPASFNTVAIGTAYQWQFNGTNLAGATTSAYSIPAVGATNAGVYACLISGANGTLSTTPAVLSVTGLPAAPGQFKGLSRLGNGFLQLTMSGTPFTNYVLEYTTNFKDWTALSTLSGTNGTFQFTDPTPTTNAERFYRLRVGP